MLGKNHSKETKERLRELSKNRIWITDGVICKMVDKTSIIPDGWIKGRIIKKRALASQETKQKMKDSAKKRSLLKNPISNLLEPHKYNEQ